MQSQKLIKQNGNQCWLARLKDLQERQERYIEDKKKIQNAQRQQPKNSFRTIE